jgi:hypothetical protein
MLFSFLLSRFCEPSSYAGLGVAANAIGEMITHGPNGSSAAQAAGGILAFFLPEGLAPTTPKPMPLTSQKN